MRNALHTTRWPRGVRRFGRVGRDEEEGFVAMETAEDGFVGR